MHQAHDHRSFAHRCRHAVQCSGSHVAGGKYAGDARLERQRLARFLPGAPEGGIGRRVPPRQHESLRVAENRRRQPVGVRPGPDEDEHGIHGLHHARSALARLQRHALDVTVALDARQRGAGTQPDVGRRPDLVDEVVRHRLVQARAPHRQVNLPRKPREVERTLARRVAPADDEHAAALDRLGFRHRRSVVDAGPGEVRDAGGIVFAVRHAGRDDHRRRDHVALVRQTNSLVAGLDRQFHHLERREELGAQPLRLRHGSPRQLAAAHAGGEAKVVLDPRARARLAARRLPIEQERPQPFGRAVNRRGEAGRPGADDDQVVEIVGDGQRAAELLGHLPNLRVAEHGAVFE